MLRGEAPGTAPWRPEGCAVALAPLQGQERLASPRDAFACEPRRSDNPIGMRILIADDDAGTRRLLKRLLERNFGATVGEVADGMYVLDTLQRAEYDLLLLDLRMPVRDGISTLKALRRAPKVSSINVIVMTASRDEGLVMDAIKLGITDYILKPFEPESLTRRLERLFLAYGYPLPFQEDVPVPQVDLPPPPPVPLPVIHDDEPAGDFSLRPVLPGTDVGLVGPLAADSPTVRLLDVLPQMVWVTGPDGRPEYLNPRAQAFLGGDETAAAGWGWLHLLHPDDVQEVRRVWTAAVRTGEAQRAEYRLQTRPRHYRWCEAEWVPLMGEHGTVLKWVGVWTDIDDRKRLQMVALRDDRTMWRQRDAVMATDPTGRVTFWNEAATRLLGWTADEMIGRSVLERFPDDVRTVVAERLRTVMGGQEWVGRFPDHRKDGSQVITEARLVALPRAGQARAGVLWVSGESGGRGNRPLATADEGDTEA